jgi:TPR repeat protein
MKRNKFFISILFLFFNLTLASANPLENPKICTESPDETGCLLNIAKIKLLRITDANKQAEAIGGVLKTNAELNRSDFELMARSFQLLKNKKLDLEHYLNLQISIATYFNKRDPKRSNLHIEQATKIFYKAIERGDPKERLILSTWACRLIDENSNIWKNISHVTAEYCSPDFTKSKSKNDEFDYENILMTMISAWVQSDFTELEKNKEILDEKISLLEEYGIKNNKKSIGIETQKIKILIYALQTDMYRRSGLQQQSKQALTQAKEALIGLEKLTNSVEAIESRLAVAYVFNKMYDHEETIAYLKPITDIFDDTKKLQKVSLNVQVEYLITLAEALDRSGFRSYNEIKLSNSELRQRQSDVLYEKYVMLNYLDKKKGVQSKETFKALKDAAEAGNAIAMHNLGVEYAHGSSTTQKDLDKAAYWYSWSAALGFAGAQNNLADLYESASDADSDMGLSIYWYTQAAMQGEPTAYLSLGDLFFHGKGVPKNYVTASIWLSLAKRHLPDGINKNKATELLNKAFASLDEKSKKYVQSRAFNFVPLKQTANKLSDKPSIGEVY